MESVSVYRMSASPWSASTLLKNRSISHLAAEVTWAPNTTFPFMFGRLRPFLCATLTCSTWSETANASLMSTPSSSITRSTSSWQFSSSALVWSLLWLSLPSMLFMPNLAAFLSCGLNSTLSGVNFRSSWKKSDASFMDLQYTSLCSKVSTPGGNPEYRSLYAPSSCMNFLNGVPALS